MDASSLLKQIYNDKMISLPSEMRTQIRDVLGMPQPEDWSGPTKHPFDRYSISPKDATHFCNRRMEVGMMPDGVNRDGYIEQKLSNGEVVHVCTNCGGMKAEDVLTQIKAGHLDEKSDKNYKGYIDLPGFHGKFYIPHFSDEQASELNRLYKENAPKRKAKWDAMLEKMWK